MTRDAKIKALKLQLAQARATKYRVIALLERGGLGSKEDKKLRKTLREYEDLELELMEMLPFGIDIGP
jgi:ribosomal protein L10